MSAARQSTMTAPGRYNLMSSSRTVEEGGNCLGPDGKPDGASCLASAWADDYYATIQVGAVQSSVRDIALRRDTGAME